MTKCMQYYEWKIPSGPLPWGVRAPLSCYFWWMIHGINQHALGLEFRCCIFFGCGMYTIQVIYKKIFWMKTSACRDGSSPTYQTRWPPQHFLHLVPFCQLCLVFVICIGPLWKTVGWVMLHGYVIHVDGYGHVVGDCNLISTEYERYGLLCAMQKL